MQQDLSFETTSVLFISFNPPPNPKPGVLAVNRRSLIILSYPNKTASFTYLRLNRHQYNKCKFILNIKYVTYLSVKKQQLVGSFIRLNISNLRSVNIILGIQLN